MPRASRREICGDGGGELDLATWPQRNRGYPGRFLRYVEATGPRTGPRPGEWLAASLVFGGTGPRCRWDLWQSLEKVQIARKLFGHSKLVESAQTHSKAFTSRQLARLSCFLT
jgi:hypothetical protein